MNTSPKDLFEKYNFYFNYKSTVFEFIFSIDINSGEYEFSELKHIDMACYQYAANLVSDFNTHLSSLNEDYVDFINGDVSSYSISIENNLLKMKSEFKTNYSVSIDKDDVIKAKKWLNDQMS
jgi:hypothetical protein